MTRNYAGILVAFASAATLFTSTAQAGCDGGQYFSGSAFTKNNPCSLWGKAEHRDPDADAPVEPGAAGRDFDLGVPYKGHISSAEEIVKKIEAQRARSPDKISAERPADSWVTGALAKLRKSLAAGRQPKL